MKRLLLLLPALSLAAAANACGANDPPPPPTVDPPADATFPESAVTVPVVCADRNPLKNAYFGDLHAHTAYSLDAYSFATRTTPVDAYAFARGERFRVAGASPDGGGPTTKLARPLDFLAVTDHAEWLGAAFGCGESLGGARFDPTSPYYESATCRAIRSNEIGKEKHVDHHLEIDTKDLCDGGACGTVVSSAWKKEQEAAAAAYLPCKFTSFVGFEWTLSIDGQTLHKNVIFGSDVVPTDPLDSHRYPTQGDLWRGLEAQCTAASGCAAITIPHNSNLSQGQAFVVPPELSTLSAKYQRLVEIFQHKGNSECLYDPTSDGGTSDPDCNFEYLGGVTEPNDRGSYVREALSDGISRDGGINPLMMGVVGSTDDHNGTPGDTREQSFKGHSGRVDDTPEERLAPPADGGLGVRAGHNPGGLAVVWAEENTRESLFAALERRETYATSGTRMVVRFFQTWSNTDACADPAFPAELVAAGASPMGGTFGPAPPGVTGGPRFVVYAWKDKTDLARIDIVKLWYDEQGQSHESIVHDVIPAGAGGSRCQVWQDPDFTPGPAVYYARVLEVPTPRWSAFDCAAAPTVDPVACGDGGGLDVMIQERAWTSPIWFAP